MNRTIFSIFFAVLFVSTAFSQFAPVGNFDGQAADLPAFSDLINTEEQNGYESSDGESRPEFVSDDRKVVFIGDSITYLWHLNEYFPRMTGFINRGIGGDTTPSILYRFRSDVIHARPRAVVILAGTNDIAGFSGPMTIEQTRDNLRAMIRMAQANRITVILSSVTPVNDTCLDPDGRPYINTTTRPPSQIFALNQLIRGLAVENNLAYIDYYSAMVDQNGLMREGLTYDGLHPNSNGYALMAPLVRSAIRSGLAQTSQ